MKTLIALLSLIAAGQCNAQLVITDGEILAGSGYGAARLNGIFFTFAVHGFLTDLTMSGGPVFAGGYLNPFVTATTPETLCAGVRFYNGMAYGASGSCGVAADMRPPSTFDITGAALHITAPGDYTSSFSLSGDFIGYPYSDYQSPPAVFIPNISGSGIVTYTFAENPQQGLFLEKESYLFNTVPEPATLSLFVLGLVGLAMSWKAVAAGPWLTLRTHLNRGHHTRRTATSTIPARGPLSSCRAAPAGCWVSIRAAAMGDLRLQSRLRQ